MSDIQTPANTPPSSDKGTTDEKGAGNGSPAPVEDNKQVEAYRKKQSEVDQGKSELDSMREDVDFLTQVAMEGHRDKLIADFLAEKGKEYPNVTADDLKRFAGSAEELDDTAKYLEGRIKTSSQSLLEEMRNVPEETMTDDEKAKALKNLESSNDPNRFAKFLRIQSIRTRKK